MLTGLPVLLYHRVGPRDGSAMDKYTVSPERFREQLALIVQGGWEVVGLDEALLAARGTARRRVVITFDDGFASNREHAWPVLAERGLPSTTFVVTSLLGSVNTWDDASMPRYPLLDLADLRSAHGSMSFQSHAATHACLTELGERALDREIFSSKSQLEDLVGRPVTSFAYPFGAWNSHVRDAVCRAGYRLACSCRQGRNNGATDRYLLRRAEIREEDRGLRFLLKLRTGTSFETPAPLMPRIRNRVHRYLRKRETVGP
jgi:peptidoglycan/xylan/chitin deacetylase (PgdA/CDA1 family)